MHPRPSFWCKCHDAYQAAWEKTMHDAAQNVWARTNKLTDLYFVAVESDFGEDAPRWTWRGEAL